MNVLSLPRNVLRAEYMLVRRTSRMAQDRLLALLPEGDSRRLRVERLQGHLDTVAGRVLGDDALTAEGTGQIARVGAATKAQDLQADAAAQRVQADDDLAAAREAAESEREAAVAQKERATTAARQTAVESRSRAATTAASHAAGEIADADDEAARHVAVAEETQRVHDAAVQSRVEDRTTEPKKNLADARALKETAAAKNQKAGRLTELAETEKQTRTETSE